MRQSKYTQEQLQAMAVASQGYKTKSPQQYHHMIMILSMFTGMNQIEIEQEIDKLARGES